jgi:proteasome lid subunit RPN8/RPN11
MIEDILNHIESEYPKEACGLIVSDNGLEKWIPCENVSEEPEEEFVINSEQFVKAQLDYKILKIVHSHPDGSAEPSDHDKKASDFINIPYMIISWPEGEIVNYG